MADHIPQTLDAIERVVHQEKAVKATQQEADEILAAAQAKLQEAEQHAQAVGASASRDLEKLQARRAALARLLGGDEDAAEESLFDEVLLETDLTSTTVPAAPTTGPGIMPPPSTSGRTTTSRKTTGQAPTTTTSGPTPPAKKRKRGPEGQVTTSQESTREIPDATYQAALDNAKVYQKFDFASTVVKGPDGDWVELRCASCKGNYSPLTQDYLKGVAAFQTHLKKSHLYPERFGWPEVVGACTFRKISSEEMIQMMKKGAIGSPFVEKVELQTDAPGSRRNVVKRQAEQSDAWKFIKDVNNSLVNCSVIVRHPEGHWVELACPVCRGNSTSDGQYLQDAAKALFDHLHQDHGEAREAEGLRGIVERCQVKEVSDEDIAKIKAGDPDAPLPTVRVVQSNITLGSAGGAGGAKAAATEAGESPIPDDEQAGEVPDDTAMEIAAVGEKEGVKGLRKILANAFGADDNDSDDEIGAMET